MARILIIESGDDWRALSIPEDWTTDDVDRYLNGMAYGRAAVVAVESLTCDRCNGRGFVFGFTGKIECDDCHGSGVAEVMAEPDSFLSLNGGEYGGGSV